MRTLKDVYIKVTKANANELMKQINRYDLQPHTYVFFAYDSIKGNEVSLIEPKNRKKVSLSQLKRLIDTIPTREEITRLKQQISAYKTNLSLVNERCKELQRDNDILVDCMEKLDGKLELTEKKLDIQADLIRDKNAQIKQLKQRKWYQIWK